MNRKRKIVTKSGAASIAQQAALCAKSFLIGIGVLADSDLIRRLLRRIVAVSSVRSCGDPARRIDPSRRSEQPHRSVLAASASSPVGVVLGPSVVSQRLNGRCQCPVYHWESSLCGSRSSYNVRLPPVDENCAVQAPMSKAL